MTPLAEASRLDGKIALITGAASGIGAVIAQHLAAAGASLVLADVAEAGLARTAAALPVDSRKVVADVTDWDGLAAVVDTDIDILVNAAGVYPSMNVLDLTEDHWDMLLDVNLKGAARMIQLCAPRMTARGGGAVVNIASVQGLRPTATKAAYAASKAGLIALTQVAARELGAAGHPGQRGRAGGRSSRPRFAPGSRLAAFAPAAVTARSRICPSAASARPTMSRASCTISPARPPVS